jgi:hypothetical protein
MACDCVTNALREHPDCYDHTNECVADRVEAAEAKGYAKALEDVMDCRATAYDEDGVATAIDAAEIRALKEKVKP